jgi:hypothetical protein
MTMAKQTAGSDEVFDYKKEYKEFYLPPKKPELIDIPEMHFAAVRGKGDPNSADGEYQHAMQLLYGIAFTIKMSYMGDHKIDGYFKYVVPPLEGFWWMDGIKGVDYKHKDKFKWISLIRLPDFVKKADFDWAVKTASEKKQCDFSAVEFFSHTEGKCVQCMHVGPYDNEPATIQLMHEFAEENGYAVDITDADASHARYHHEIYLSDARKCAPEKLRTVIRLPVKETR